MLNETLSAESYQVVYQGQGQGQGQSAGPRLCVTFYLYLYFDHLEHNHPVDLRQRYQITSPQDTFEEAAARGLRFRR